jgi:pyridoxal phosphate enzyme (YggS family)
MPIPGGERMMESRTIMGAVAEGLQAVRARIAAAAHAAGRDAGAVGLVAVSKTFAPGRIRKAAEAGQRAFGENYAQEGAAKAVELADLGLEWHFIGPLQSNKTRLVAEHFHWVHSVDREKIAQRLAAQRPPGLGALQVCLQVNVSGEATKGGVEPGGLPALAAAVAGLPGLRLRGLMAIPEPTHDPDLQRARFRQLRGLLKDLNARGLGLDTLSMGMSDDLEAAIIEGATLVRVGRAIFGARAPAPGV